jgi:hypothetical protein
LEPSNRKGKCRKTCVFYDFVVNRPVFEEIDSKKGMRNMPRRRSNTSEEQFQNGRSKFLGNGAKNERNPISKGIEDDSLHEKNLL